MPKYTGLGQPSEAESPILSCFPPTTRMSPTELLAAHVQQKLALSPDELAELLAQFKPRLLKKKQLLIQPGFVATSRSFVAQGALHAYLVDAAGRERTIQLAIDDWWITDYNSYTYQQPATMFVAALEDSRVLQLDYAAEQRLKAASHRFETFFRLLAERAAAYQQRRIIAEFMQTAEQRYDDLLAHYPKLSQRIPLRVLASYLNMTPEFLSKIRHKKLNS
jgi:CRP-like cAMP-binding protein